MNQFERKAIVLGVTGGIACYKACELASRLVAAGADVDVVMTPAATQFVGPVSFQALTGHPVCVEMFGAVDRYRIVHVALAEKADVVLVAPLTANTLAKIAHGMADNLLTSTILATRAPVVLAPAMNVGMYENPKTQENLRIVREKGAFVVEPESGRLACGAVGKGRLAELHTILDEVAVALTRQDLAGRRIVVTAGPTREPLDPVRYLGNRSSGKMGYAIARVLRRRGARVMLISGPSSVPVPPGVEVLAVETACEMEAALGASLVGADALIMAAAVCDYRPAEISREKLKKRARPLELKLVENPDLLAGCRGPYVRVGFAAESESLLDNAREKLSRKSLDLVAANDVTRADSAFGSDTNRVAFVNADGVEELPTLPKEDVAERLADRLVDLLARREETCT